MRIYGIIVLISSRSEIMQNYKEKIKIGNIPKSPSLKNTPSSWAWRKTHHALSEVNVTPAPALHSATVYTILTTVVWVKELSNDVLSSLLALDTSTSPRVPDHRYSAAGTCDMIGCPSLSPNVQSASKGRSCAWPTGHYTLSVGPRAK